MVDEVTTGNNDISTTSVESNEMPTSLKNRFKKLPSKGCLIFMHGTIGSTHPYLILFFKSIGLSPSHGGIIVGLRVLVSAISMQCCSAIGRYTSYNRYWFWFSCMLSLLTFFPMPWVAISNYLAIDTRLNFNCTSSSPIDIPRNEQFSVPNCYTNDTQIYTMFFVMLSMNVGNAAIECIIPGYTNPVVKSIFTDYGQTFDIIRNNLYSGIGYGSGSLVSGITSDYFKPANLSNYTSTFLVYLGFSVLFLISTIFVFEQFTTNPDENEDSFRILFQVCWKLKNIVFLGTVILAGIANGILSSFLLVVLDEMHSSRTLMGVCIIISSMSEVFMFTLAQKFTFYINKPLRYVCLCIFQYVLRFLLISYTTKVWMVLPIQLLNIFGYPLFWIAVSDYIRVISPMQTINAMQNLIHTCYYVVGGIIANILGGSLYAAYQGKLWFGYIGYFYLFLAILLTFYIILDETYLQRRALRMSSFSSQHDFASSSISEIRDKILLDDELDTYA